MESRAKRRQPRRRGNPIEARIKTRPDAFNLDQGAGGRAHFGFLDDGAIEKLKDRAFELLETYGVVFIHPLAAEALKKAGAKPGSGADRLRLPRRLVAEALEAAPKQVSLYGKKPARDMHLPRSDSGFVMRTGTGAHGYVDPETGIYRNLDLKAVGEIAAVANDLDEVGFIAHPFVDGVPEITADIHGFAKLIPLTDKHVWMQPYQKENIEYLLRIAAIAAGGEDELRAHPSTSVITCSFSPLEFKYMDTEAIIQAGKYGVPVHACSLPSAGGTAPLSVPASGVIAGPATLGITHMA